MLLEAAGILPGGVIGDVFLLEAIVLFVFILNIVNQVFSWSCWELDVTMIAAWGLVLGPFHETAIFYFFLALVGL